MSEAAMARDALEKYCVGIGIEFGAGGDPLSKNSITQDQFQPYTKVGDVKQILRGDCRAVPYVCDEFTYEELVPIILEWRRILKPGGFLIMNCPDQRVFKRHITLTGQGDNEAHREKCMSLFTFKDRVLAHTGAWEILYECPLRDGYSWHLVCKKI
jgi:SAM-dependent methyltransferase